MHIFRVNRLPLYQAPDVVGAVADPPVVDPAVDPAVAVAGDPPVAADPPAGDPPASDDHGNKGKSPWFLKRIADEAERARVAEQRATDAEALAARLQAGTNPPAGDPPRAPAAPSGDFNTAVQREAQRQRMAEDSTAVRDAGVKEFGADFSQTLSILTAVGATSDDMVLDLLAVDKPNAHKILANLAKDPEKAASLVGMDSRRRIAELTRMADALAPKIDPAAPAKPAAPGKQISKTPAPPPPVDPSASKVTDWRADEASDDEFDRGFKDMMAKRSARR